MSKEVRRAKQALREAEIELARAGRKAKFRCELEPTPSGYKRWACGCVEGGDNPCHCHSCGAHVAEGEKSCLQCAEECAELMYANERTDEERQQAMLMWDI